MRQESLLNASRNLQFVFGARSVESRSKKVRSSAGYICARGKLQEMPAEVKDAPLVDDLLIAERKETRDQETERFASWSLVQEPAGIGPGGDCQLDRMVAGDEQVRTLVLEVRKPPVSTSISSVSALLN